MKTIRAIKGGVDVVLRWFVVILFIAMIALVTWQVIIRQVFNSGSSWTEVLSRIVFVWQGLIGAAYLIGEKEDVAIDWLVRKFSLRISQSVQILAHLMVAAFAAFILVWGGQRLVGQTWTNTVQLLPISQGMVYSVLPIAGALILFYTLYHIVELIVDPKLDTDDDEFDLEHGQLPDEEGI